MWIADNHTPDLPGACPFANNAADTGTFRRPLRYGDRGAKVVVATVTEDRPARRLRIVLDRDVIESEHRRQLREQVARTTRLDLDLAEFHRLHPEAAARGFGRLFRSPTLWEDMIKTITNCNMQWVGTVAMNRGLCDR